MTPRGPRDFSRPGGPPDGRDPRREARPRRSPPGGPGVPGGRTSRNTRGGRSRLGAADGSSFDGPSSDRSDGHPWVVLRVGLSIRPRPRASLQPRRSGRAGNRRGGPVPSCTVVRVDRSLVSAPARCPHPVEPFGRSSVAKGHPVRSAGPSVRRVIQSASRFDRRSAPLSTLSITWSNRSSPGGGPVTQVRPDARPPCGTVRTIDDHPSVRASRSPEITRSSSPKREHRGRPVGSWSSR